MKFADYGLTVTIHGYFDKRDPNAEDNGDSDVQMTIDLPTVGREHIEANNPALAAMFGAFDDFTKSDSAASPEPRETEKS